MTDYTPSPELVEDLVAFAEAHNEYEQCASQLIGGWGEVADVENLFDHVLTAAVAYRTPSGDPELDAEAFQAVRLHTEAHHSERLPVRTPVHPVEPAASPVVMLRPTVARLATPVHRITFPRYSASTIIVRPFANVISYC